MRIPLGILFQALLAFSVST